MTLGHYWYKLKDGYLSGSTRYNECCFYKQWEKRFLASPHSSLSWVKCMQMRLISAFIFTVASEDELGPNGKRICLGISSSIISELADCNALLSQKRKKRQVISASYGLGVSTKSNFDIKSHTEYLMCFIPLDTINIGSC